MDFYNHVAEMYKQQEHRLAALGTAVYMEHRHIVDPVVDVVRSALPYVQCVNALFYSAEHNFHVDFPDSVETVKNAFEAVEHARLPEAAEQWDQAEYVVERDEWMDSTDLSPDLSGQHVEKDIAETQALQEAHQAELTAKQQEHELARQAQDKAIEDRAEKFARAYEGDALDGFLKQLNEAAEPAKADLAKKQETELQEMAARHEAELGQLARDQIGRAHV